MRSGRYGPYVNHGKVNATLPRDMKPEDVTVEQALELPRRRKRAGRPRRNPSEASAAKKKAPAKKAAKKARAKAPVE